MTPLLFASSNPHKLDEVRAILAPLGLSVLGLHDVTLPTSGAPASSLPEPLEDGDTFEANSRIKALYYALHTHHLCLADDSGLEVDALNGAPGIHSAYFAHGAQFASGVAAPNHSRAERDAANNAKLLALLADNPDDRRAARFVCVMTAATPDPSTPDGARVLATARGHFEGRIAHSPKGDNGFGYDPLLLLPDGRTSAELPPLEKNARSHRAAAARAIAPALLSSLRVSIP